MKKKFILLWACIALCVTVKAQPPTLKNVFDSLYNYLDPVDFSTGIFHDRYPSFTDVPIFNGKVDTAFGNYKIWKQIYFELSNAAFDTTAFTPLDTVVKNSQSWVKKDTIPLGILFYDYNTYREDAVTNGFVSYDSINEEIDEVVSIPDSLYETKNVFAMSPLTPHVYRGENLVYLDSSFYFTNNPFGGSASIAIDFDNGSGFITLGWGDVAIVDYTDTPEYVTWTVRVVKSSDTIFAKAKIPLKRKATLGPGEYSFTFTSPVPWNTTYPIGLVTVKKGIDPVTGTNRPINTCFKKPLIILDGVDFGSEEIGPRGCKDGNCGSLGWFDLSQPDLNEWPQLEKMPQLIADLNLLEYDVIFLDNEYGGDYIQHNAMLLVQLIQKINDEKCDCDELVIIGPSMGGIVAKYALSYMENNNLSHQTRLYIAFDSPHKGANVPLGAQEAIEYFRGSSDDAKHAYEDKLGSPAARQLLAGHVLSSGYNPDNLRTTILSELTTLGEFPKNLRKVSVINGSKTVQEVYAPANEQHLEYKWDGVVVNAKMNTWGIPGVGKQGENNVIAHLNNPSAHKKLVSIPSNTQQFDNCPGAIGNFLTDFEGQQHSGRIKVGIVTLHQREQTFISSVSSLATVQNTLYYDIDANLNPSEPQPLDYPFDAYFAPDDNELHVQVTTANADWVLDEIVNNDTYFGSLPNSFGSTFNFGLLSHKKIPSVTIGSGGTLQVNGNYNTLYGTGITAPFSTIEMIVSDCEPVIIDNGGVFLVGDNTPTPNKTATVRFVSGTILEIKNGGELEIFNNSKVIIELGAKLVYHPGAQILLSGENAILEVKGELQVMNGATFTFGGSAVPHGFIRFDLTNGTAPGLTVTGTTAQVSLSGGNVPGVYEDKVLEIIGRELIMPNANNTPLNYLDEFTIYNGMVNLKDGGAVESSVPGSFTYTYFNGEGAAENETGLIVLDPANTTVHHCSFKNLSTGLSIFMGTGGGGYDGPFPVSYSSFVTNGTGMQTSEGSFDITNSTFASNTTGISSAGLTDDCEVEYCFFGSNTTGMTLTGASTTNCWVFSSEFTGNTYGIQALSSVNLTLECSKFKNHTSAVEASSSSNLNLSPNKTFGGHSGGDCVFYDNGNALYADYSLYLEDGNNNFINIGGCCSTNMFILGNVIYNSLILYDFYSSPTTVKADNNYWSPAPSMGNISNGSPDLYIITGTNGGSSVGLSLDGPSYSTFTSTCFTIPSGTEPQFVSSWTGPFNKMPDMEPPAEKTTFNKLSVYPNPANDKLYIQTATNEEKIYAIRIFDLVGRQVVSENVKALQYAKLEIPTANLSNGTYLLSISTDDGMLNENHKIVILK